MVLTEEVSNFGCSLCLPAKESQIEGTEIFHAHCPASALKIKGGGFVEKLHELRNGGGRILNLRRQTCRRANKQRVKKKIRRTVSMGPDTAILKRKLRGEKGETELSFRREKRKPGR